MSTTLTDSNSSKVADHDMSDRFGPMLVKELRQGLRTKVFLTAFIGFQTILVILVLAGFGAHSNGSSSEFLNASIWTVLMVMMVVITPMRGQFAIEKELRMGTLELLQITDLNAWQIVRGKWSALMGEAMLYLTAALPYFTLRYFLGGVQILSDLALLALLAVFSATLTAIVVGLSGFKSVLLRVGIAIGVVMLMPMCLSLAEEFGSPYGPFSGMGMSNFNEWWGLLVAFLVTQVVVGWGFLQLGARSIGTQAENHSSQLRIWTILGLGVVIGLDHYTGSVSSTSLDDTQYFFWIMIIALYACGIFCAFTDSSLQSTRIYAPFIKRSVTPIGRLLLYPGWGAGFVYVVLLSFLVLASRAIVDEPEIVMLGTLFVYNVLAQPAAITRILMRNRLSRTFNLSTFITMLVGCLILSGVLVIAEAAVTDGEPILSLIFPVPAIVSLDFHDESISIAVQFISALIVTGILLIAAIEDMGFTRRREHATRDFMADNAMKAAKPPLVETPETIDPDSVT